MDRNVLMFLKIYEAETHLNVQSSKRGKCKLAEVIMINFQAQDALVQESILQAYCKVVTIGHLDDFYKHRR